MKIQPNKFYRHTSGTIVIAVGARTEELFDRWAVAVELIDYACEQHWPQRQGLGVYHLSGRVCEGFVEITPREFREEWARLTAETFRTLERESGAAICLNFPRRSDFDYEKHDATAFVSMELEVRGRPFPSELLGVSSPAQTKDILRLIEEGETCICVGSRSRACGAHPGES